MAIDDNTSYELTGAQVKDLANKIKAKAADNIFVGATSAIPGSKGLVPAPQAGDDARFLSGDGTWKTVSTGQTYTAGNGIDIDANNEISIDTTVVAEISDIPTKTSDLQNDGSDGTSTYVEADDYATPAAAGVIKTTGSFGVDMSNSGEIKGTVVASANYPSMWNDAIVSKGTLENALSTKNYATMSDLPTVNDATLTITQNGTSVGTFTANASSNTTIALTDTTYTAGNHIDITNDVITAEGYIWGDTLTSATTPTGTVTSGMIADGTIQATDIATGVVPVITMTSTDPGEGSPLAANNFIAVYEP